MYHVSWWLEESHPIAYMVRIYTSIISKYTNSVSAFPCVTVYHSGCICMPNECLSVLFYVFFCKIIRNNIIFMNKKWEIILIKIKEKKKKRISSSSSSSSTKRKTENVHNFINMAYSSCSHTSRCHSMFFFVFYFHIFVLFSSPGNNTQSVIWCCGSDWI